MFKNIMIPVDLAHSESPGRAVDISADLAEHYGASACLVGVTAPQPSEVAHNPREFEEKLTSYAAAQSARLGFTFASKAMTSNDPTIELDTVLQDAAGQLGADLIVMSSHVPGYLEHFISSNAGYLASHTERSVLVVR